MASTLESCGSRNMEVARLIHRMPGIKSRKYSLQHTVEKGCLAASCSWTIFTDARSRWPRSFTNSKLELNFVIFASSNTLHIQECMQVGHSERTVLRRENC